MIINKAFYFIRHGKTDWNLNKASTQQTDIPLNNLGIQQAQKATLLFKHRTLTAVISSPLLRAKQTAEILSSFLGLPLSFNNGLQERNFGSAMEQCNEIIIGPESETKFEKRVIFTLNSILESEELPLIVSHGDVLPVISRVLLHENISPDNCVPYLFIPPTQENPSWTLSTLVENI